MELILIRHGLPEVEVNEDGTLADPALSAEGRVQADKLAVWMARSGIDRIYSSPMQRALQTSEPLAATLNLPVEVIDAVAEFDRDEGSYVPLEVIKETDPERYRAVVSYDTDARFESFQSAVVGALGSNSPCPLVLRCLLRCPCPMPSRLSAAALPRDPL